MAGPERKTQSKWQAAPSTKQRRFYHLLWLQISPARAATQITFLSPPPLNYRCDDTFRGKFDIERFIRAAGGNFHALRARHTTQTQTRKPTNQTQKTNNEMRFHKIIKTRFMSVA